MVSTRDDRADVAARRPITARVPAPSQPAPCHPPVGVAKGENIARRWLMRTPSCSLPDQTAVSDIRPNRKDLEDMLKRIFEIAQIVANATSPGLEVNDRDDPAAQKHNSPYLQ